MMQVEKRLNQPQKRLFTVTEAGHYIGISPRTIYNGICRGSKKPFPIKPVRMGRKPFFRKEDLDAFIDSLMAE